jgi:hypothetical protein
MRQYTQQSEGAKTLGQWPTAVTSMKGESDKMSVSDAAATIHATPSGGEEPVREGDLEAEEGARDGSAGVGGAVLIGRRIRHSAVTRFGGSPDKSSERNLVLPLAD